MRACLGWLIRYTLEEQLALVLIQPDNWPREGKICPRREDRALCTTISPVHPRSSVRSGERDEPFGGHR